MSDLINREEAIEAIFKVGHEHVEEKVIPLGAVTDYSDAIKALPSAEAVSREEYDQLERLYDAIRVYDSSAEAVHKPDYSYEADMVKRLRQAEAVQGWITDRNPTENGTYIVTIADEDGGFVCELNYGEPLMPICKVNGACWYDADDDFGDCPYYDILAWMPLPKPYKGGDTE